MKILRKLWQCFSYWSVPPDTIEDMKVHSGVAIVELSHYLKNSQPYNIGLAQVIIELMNDLEKPAILVEDIAACIPGFSVNKNCVIPHYGPDSLYPNTQEVLREAKKMLQGHINWKYIVLVAHPEHMWRVMMMAKKLGFIPMIANTEDVFCDTPSNHAIFEEDATLFSPSVNRGLDFMVLYEILARITSLFSGWI